MRIKLKLLIPLMGLLLLFGCGGGSSSDETPTVSTTKAWGTAELLETLNADNATAPQIAFDAAGNAIAVWSQYDGEHGDIWANRFNGTTGIWDGADRIESGDDGNAYGPQIAFDPDGNAIAVWYQVVGSIVNAYANRFNDTTSTWDGEDTIETSDDTPVYVPQIAFDDDGTAIAVWYQHDGTRYNVWANRFDGTAWGTAELLETDDTSYAGDPQIAFDADGNAIAVWYQNDGTRNNIYANRFNGTTDIWEGAASIETDTGNAGAPQIAFDPNGNAIAVWPQFDGTYNNIWANRFDGTAWGTAALIETDDAGSANSPQIAIDADGNAIAIWTQYDGTYHNIYINQFDGTAWGSTAELIETGDDPTYNPQIAFDADGNAIAVWKQSDGTFDNIWANRFE